MKTLEDVAKWHDEQAAYWKDMAKHSFKNLSEEGKAEQHMRECGNRIIHEQSARHIRAMAKNVEVPAPDKLAMFEGIPGVTTARY